VFENYALYPHLDVYHNIAMPLVARRLTRSAIREQVGQIAAVLRLTEHLRQLPRQLSGGQRQRVALGRALVRSPGTFLMDEPLGHLEAYLRGDLRAEIRRMHEMRSTTTVYITHDQQEAGAVADRIAVMNAGRLQQVGSMVELVDSPVNRFVAQFVGELPINLMPARIAGGPTAPELRIGDVAFALSPAQGDAVAPSSDAELELGIRPDDIAICDPDRPGTLRAQVAVVEPQGDASFILADTGAGRIGVTAASHAAPHPGAIVGLAPDIARSHLFAPSGVNLFARAARGGEG
jgi:multiple sugar transport system ATP-binding protein